jgi:hypothetical protein
VLPLPPLSRCVNRKLKKKLEKILFCFSEKKIASLWKNGEEGDKTNTGEGGKDKKGRTVSDDAGGKSLSDTSTSAGVKSTAIRTSVNIFETSKRDKAQYLLIR